ncbi:GNAT family N-acetyltransferase [Actinosynnema pretiosum subsp. pretiosum]|uniref:GNAT family N-acetyltransferase n=1 Tax=Actinosynnema pretiosum subsp. pretiosum TaxID=103721 RepID=A0AA45R7I0_9PSEU|nr:GNAT family N-acetyltransferase [Actinosynnema pretiosum subsp. pretiosum]
MTPDDVPACLALATGRGWSHEERKWRLLLATGTGLGLFDGSTLVGTTVLTRYGDAHAALSMVLVAEGRQGRGLGRRLVEAALERADAPVVSLHATEQGLPLYEKLGFVVSGPELVTHFGVFTGPPSGATSPPADPAALVALDAEVFGADRSALWEAYLGFAERVVVSASGFAGCWADPSPLVVGPVVAEDVAGARELVADLVSGRDARVDTADPGLRAWLLENGMREGYRVAPMVLGATRPPGRRERLFAPIAQALG